MSKVIGIDLGTTNSCVAVLEGKDPVVIPNQPCDPIDAFQCIRGRLKRLYSPTPPSHSHDQASKDDKEERAGHLWDFLSGIPWGTGRHHSGDLQSFKILPSPSADPWGRPVHPNPKVQCRFLPSEPKLNRAGTTWPRSLEDGTAYSPPKPEGSF